MKRLQVQLFDHQALSYLVRFQIDFLQLRAILGLLELRKNLADWSGPHNYNSELGSMTFLFI
jgi:hypothetical protein